MRWLLVLVFPLAMLLPWHEAVTAPAPDPLNVCHAQSSYDLTLGADGITFDRDVVPRRVRMHDGALDVDGTTVDLDKGDRERIRAFERDVRVLVPKIRALATQGVDLATEAVREQARESTPELASGGELDARLGNLAADLKARIAHSRSTHDWHGETFRQYVNQGMAGIVPMLAGGLLQQSMGLAMNGDFDSVSRLRERAANLADTLQARIRRKLTVLEPRIRSLCPTLQELDRLENGLDASMPDGSRLDLLTLGQQ